MVALLRLLLGDRSGLPGTDQGIAAERDEHHLPVAPVDVTVIGHPDISQSSNYNKSFNN